MHPTRCGPSPGWVPVKSASSLFCSVGTWERDLCWNPVRGLGKEEGWGMVAQRAVTSACWRVERGLPLSGVLYLEYLLRMKK